MGHTTPNEAQYVLDAFEQNFGALKGRPIALYGIGRNTEHILAHFTEHNVVGLMDEVRTGDTLYGLPILNCEQADALGVKNIVIVARLNNVGIIYRRIADFCTAHGIAVFDINGRRLGLPQTETKTFDQYRAITRRVLEEKIRAADTVSFDVFDTLVMRRVLYPRDVFALMERRLERAGRAFPGFAGVRAKAEAELYGAGGHPTLADIYDRLAQTHRLDDTLRGELLQVELQTERDCLVPRAACCEMLALALALGKEVFLTSDMYLPGDVLRPLLAELGVPTEDTQILVSCDFGVPKGDGLFDILRERATGRRILHIGDNEDADIHSARRHGIDDTFYLKSAAAMLEDAQASALLRFDGTLTNRMVIGELIAKMLNDPFLFSTTDGKFALEQDGDLACFIAPLLTCFVGWMARTAREQGLERILLGARDGYILQKMCEILRADSPDLPRTDYFYTSRMAAVLAGLRNEEDILKAARFAYAGTLEQMLERRYLLPHEEILPRGELDEEAYLLAHSEKILRRAEQARANYRQYLRGLDIAPGSRVGFMDFVALGTCQRNLAHFANFALYGLYFARISDPTPHDTSLEASSMFPSANLYSAHWRVLENYFLLENVLTSYEPTLEQFDVQGRPVFFPEVRTPQQFDRLKEIHGALLDQTRNTLLDMEQSGEVDLGLLDLLYGLLDGQYSLAKTDYFNLESLEDTFSGRVFDLKDFV